MLSNALRALLTGGPSDHNRDWAKAALDRYDYCQYRRGWPDSETEARR